jgi:hypothetical protein
MQTAEQVLEDLRRWKELGTSTKFPIHSITLERLARQAKAYEELPAYIREVADAVRGKS